MAVTDSKASFTAGATEIGAQEDFIGLLKDAGIETFGQLAFCCGGDLSSADDTKLLDAAETAMGRDLTTGEKIMVRRLWFEARTLCVSELKARVERADDELPRKMPLVERMSRLENQKKRLTGIIWTSQTEPSHALLDWYPGIPGTYAVHF